MDQVSNIVASSMIDRKTFDTDNIIEMCIDDVLYLPDLDVASSNLKLRSNSSIIRNTNTSSSSSSSSSQGLSSSSSSSSSSFTSNSNSSSSSSNLSATSLGKASARNSQDIVEVTTNSPFNEVLKVFPNAKKSFVKSKLEELDYNVEAVVTEFLEKGYEKDVVNTKPIETSRPIDFASVAAFEPSKLYLDQAFLLLQQSFPYFYAASLKGILAKQEIKGRFALALLFIEDTLKIDSSQPETAVRNELLAKKARMDSHNIKLKSSKSKTGVNIDILDDNLNKVSTTQYLTLFYRQVLYIKS